MGKQAKAKTNKGERNTERRNGKAYSTGTVRHKGVSLGPVAKVLLGKGQLVQMAEVKCSSWQVSSAREPFDAATVAENKILYPHLFR